MTARWKKDGGMTRRDRNEDTNEDECSGKQGDCDGQDAHRE